jgi:hypothetical protein
MRVLTGLPINAYPGGNDFPRCFDRDTQPSARTIGAAERTHESGDLVVHDRQADLSEESQYFGFDAIDLCVIQ